MKTYELTPEDIRNLREATGAGMVDCRKALVKTHGYRDLAIRWLEVQGTFKTIRVESDADTRRDQEAQ